MGRSRCVRGMAGLVFALGTIGADETAPGAVLWAARALPGPVAFLELRGDVVCAAGESWFRALDARSGGTLWERGLVELTANRRVLASERDGDALFLGGSVRRDLTGGWLWKHDARDGSSLWTEAPLVIPGPVRAIRASGSLLFAGGPGPRDLFDRDIHFRGWVGCYDASTGRKIWERSARKRMEAVHDLLLHGKTVLAVGRFRLAALDGATGDLLWALDVDRRIDAARIEGRSIWIGGVSLAPSEDELPGRPLRPEGPPDGKDAEPPGNRAWLARYDIGSGRRVGAEALLERLPGEVRAFTFAEGRAAIAGIAAGDVSNGWVASYDPAKASWAWEAAPEVVPGPVGAIAADGPVVFAAGADAQGNGWWVAFEASGGRRLWSRKHPRDPPVRNLILRAEGGRIATGGEASPDPDLDDWSAGWIGCLRAR